MTEQATPAVETNSVPTAREALSSAFEKSGLTEPVANTPEEGEKKPERKPVEPELTGRDRAERDALADAADRRGILEKHLSLFIADDEGVTPYANSEQAWERSAEGRDRLREHFPDGTDRRAGASLGTATVGRSRHPRFPRSAPPRKDLV